MGKSCQLKKRNVYLTFSQVSFSCNDVSVDWDLIWLSSADRPHCIRDTQPTREASRLSSPVGHARRPLVETWLEQLECHFVIRLKSKNPRWCDSILWSDPLSSCSWPMHLTQLVSTAEFECQYQPLKNFSLQRHLIEILRIILHIWSYCHQLVSLNISPKFPNSILTESHLSNNFWGF